LRAFLGGRRAVFCSVGILPYLGGDGQTQRRAWRRMTTDMKTTKNLTQKREVSAKLKALRAAIDEGDASGIARGDVFACIRKSLLANTRPTKENRSRNRKQNSAGFVA
jgi:hypothetical protein